MDGVLITRPEPGASRTADSIAGLGLTPILAPVLRIRPAAAMIEPPAGFAATVLTSGNAVAACSPACHARPAFAVGSATADRARRHGFGHVIDADADAAALPDLIAATIGAGRQTLFLPAGRHQGHDLAAELRGRAWRVVRRVAYEAAPVAALPPSALCALQTRKVRFAMFFSGETARHFVRLVREAGVEDTLRTVEAVSISERAAVALRLLPWRQVRVAARPNQDAMLVLLK